MADLSSAATLTSPFSALVVDPGLTDVMFAVSALSSAGFNVTATGDFRQAKAILASRPPMLLVTAARLAEFNGLHLVLHGRAARLRIAAVVTTRAPDLVLQRETEAMDATLVALPTTREEFVTAVYRTALRRSGEIPAEPIRAPFDRRRGERRAPQTVAVIPERRKGERRRDIAGLLLRVATRQAYA